MITQIHELDIVNTTTVLGSVAGAWVEEDLAAAHVNVYTFYRYFADDYPSYRGQPWNLVKRALYLR